MENKFLTWVIRENGKVVDKVRFVATMGASEVRDALLSTGMPPTIQVVAPR